MCLKNIINVLYTQYDFYVVSCSNESELSSELESKSLSVLEDEFSLVKLLLALVVGISRHDELSMKSGCEGRQISCMQDFLEANKLESAWS